MKSPKLMLLIFMTLIPVACKSQSAYVGVSLLLSGHVFVGFKAQYFWDNQNWVETTVFPIVPGTSGFPFAVVMGVKHAFNTRPWQPFLGGEMAVIASPLMDHRRKWLVMINTVPGLRFHANNFFAVEIGGWISTILRPRFKPVRPTGIEAGVHCKM